MEVKPAIWKRDRVFTLALTVMVIFAYLPIWHAGFIWDDDAHLTNNPCIVGPLGFSAIWTSSEATYYPLVLTTFSAVHALWGLNPLPYHLLNLFLHVANALLLWRVLRALEVRGAWLGAALWALHPVMVQSVAWITELKNTQSCFFYLLSTLTFLHFHERLDPKRWHPFAWALLFFVLAITSKTSTVMLPVALSLCAWWIDRRWSWYNQLFLLPFFLISAAASAWTVWEQKFHSLALGNEWTQTWPERFAIAGYDFWFHLEKLIWPSPLIFIYPRWQIDGSNLLSYIPTLLAASTLFFLWFRRDGILRPVFFAGAYFGALLFPVLGFFDVYFFRYSYVSDHFQYLASIGPLALIGAGLASVSSPILPLQRAWWLGCGVLLVALGVLTWRQSRTYENGEVLYRKIISDNPACWLAHNNLGSWLLEQNRVDEAIGHLNAALQVKPDYTEAHYNLGDAWLRKGMIDEAILHYQCAIKSNPTSYLAHNNLGLVYFQTGRIEEAIYHYLASLKVNPNYAEAHNNLGNAYFKKERLAEAKKEYLAALEAKPGYAEAHHNLGILLSNEGQYAEAITQFQNALISRPSYAEARSALGNTYLQTGQIAGAIAQYREAYRLNASLLETGNNLAWLLATTSDPSLRNGGEAMELAQQISRLRGNSDPVALGTLAAAYAEDQRFPEAIETARRGAEIARSAGNASLAEALETYVILYRQNKPVRTALPAATKTPSR